MLCKWCGHLELLRQVPHIVSCVECNFFSSGVLCLALLGFQYVFTQSPMCPCQSLMYRVHMVLRSLIRCFQYFELHFSVPMVHGPEQCHPSRSMHSVIVRQICQGIEFSPVVLFIVAKDSVVLIPGLVLPFVWPSVCWWQPVISRWPMLMWDRTRFQIVLVICVWRSVMILLGTPYLRCRYLRNVLAKSSESISFQQGR